MKRRTLLVFLGALIILETYQREVCWAGFFDADYTVSKGSVKSDFRYFRDQLQIDCDENSELGRGRLGVVYKCSQTSTGENFAVKVSNLVLTDYPYAKESVLEKLQGFVNWMAGYEEPVQYISRPAIRELGVLQSVSNNPQVVHMKGYQIREERLYLFLEEMAVDLATYVNDGNKIKNPLKSTREMIKAVRNLHALGISQLDISTNNILVNSDGELKISDFGSVSADLWVDPVENGIQCYLEDHLKRPPVEWRTPGHTAPEVLLGQVAVRASLSDYWALGTSLYAVIESHLLVSGDGNNGDRIDSIFQVFGTPTSRRYPSLFRLKGFKALGSGNPVYEPKDFADLFKSPDVSHEWLGLIRALLQPDPNQRSAALLDLDIFKNPDVVLPMQQHLGTSPEETSKVWSTAQLAKKGDHFNALRSVAGDLHIRSETFFTAVSIIDAALEEKWDVETLDLRASALNLACVLYEVTSCKLEEAMGVTSGRILGATLSLLEWMSNSGYSIPFPNPTLPYKLLLQDHLKGEIGHSTYLRALEALFSLSSGQPIVADERALVNSVLETVSTVPIEVSMLEFNPGILRFAVLEKLKR